MFGEYFLMGSIAFALIAVPLISRSKKPPKMYQLYAEYEPKEPLSFSEGYTETPVSDLIEFEW